MDKGNNKIKLYTSQSDIVLQIIEKDGVCYSKKEFVSKKYSESSNIFITAYSWFVKEAEKIVKKPEKAEYPYWAFKDLYNVDDSAGGNILTLKVPLEEAIFFDLFDWNKIICMKYIGVCEEDEKEFKENIKKLGLKETNIMLTNFYPELKMQIMESWKFLFRHHKNIKIVNIDKIGKVQVGLWQIKQRMHYKMFVKIVKRVLLIEPAF